MGLLVHAGAIITHVAFNRDVRRRIQAHCEGMFAVGMEHAPVHLAVAIEMMQLRVEIAG